MAAIGLGLALSTRSPVPAAQAQAGQALNRDWIGEGWGRLKQADNVAMIVEIVLLVLFVALLGAAAWPLLRGVNGVLLIGGVLILGLIIPLALQFRAGIQGAKTSASPTVLVSALILLGGLIMRMVIVMGGQGLL
jgi:formate-dependent nitrite reductase membrane component NrfD